LKSIRNDIEGMKPDEVIEYGEIGEEDSDWIYCIYYIYKLKMEEIFDLIENGDEMRKFSDYFQLIKLLGRGAFGVVVHARNLTTD